MTQPVTPAEVEAIRERHAKITKLEDEIPLTTFEGNRDDCQAVWKLPAHAARVLCELRNAVPELLSDIDTLLRHIDDLTDERDAVAAFVGYDPSPGAHYDLPAAVKDFVAGETDAAAKAERERCVAWLRERAETLIGIGGQVPVEHGLACNNAADAIARGDSEPNESTKGSSDA